IRAAATDPTGPPEGQWLAYANLATSTIWLCEATGANPRAVTEPEPALMHRQAAFSHDGRQLAFVRRMGGPYDEVAVIDLATRKLRYVTQDGVYAASPVWSLDDQWIYFASSRGGTVNIWKTALTGGQREQITAGQGDDTQLDLSADGKRIVFSSYRSNINLAQISLDAGGGRLKWLTTDAARGELGPAYSPDGRRIAYFSNRKGVEKEGIWVMDADGSNPMQLVDDEYANIFPRWARDGQSLFYHAGPRRQDPIARWANSDFRRVELSGATPERLPFTGNPVLGEVGPDGHLAFFGPSRHLRI